MRAVLLRLAALAPGSVRRLALRLLFGAPRNCAERALLSAWYRLRPPRRSRPAPADEGPPIIVVDATGLSVERLSSHLDAATDPAAALADRAVLLWLVDVAEVVTVTRRGWLVDRVGPPGDVPAAGVPDEVADTVEERLALLRRTLPVLRTVRVPDDVRAWSTPSILGPA